MMPENSDHPIDSPVERVGLYDGVALDFLGLTELISLKRRTEFRCTLIETLFLFFTGRFFGEKFGSEERQKFNLELVANSNKIRLTYHVNYIAVIFNIFDWCVSFHFL